MPNAGELTDEVVDSFLPWSDRVPESCKLDPAAAEKAKECVLASWRPLCERCFSAV